MSCHPVISCAGGCELPPGYAASDYIGHGLARLTALWASGCVIDALWLNGTRDPSAEPSQHGHREIYRLVDVVAHGMDRTAGVDVVAHGMDRTAGDSTSAELGTTTLQ